MKKEKTIKHFGEEYKFIFKKHKRARRFKVSVYREGKIVVTMPRFIPYYPAEKMVIGKSDWIINKIKEIGEKPERLFFQGGKEEYAKLKKTALLLAEKRVSELNKIYGFSFNKISIRNQMTRWGSCSQKGNLSFNYRVALLPEKLADYIFAHELCHLEEFNHSKMFWQLVRKTVPDFRDLRKEMRGL